MISLSIRNVNETLNIKKTQLGYNLFTNYSYLNL